MLGQGGDAGAGEGQSAGPQVPMVSQTGLCPPQEQHRQWADPATRRETVFVWQTALWPVVPSALSSQRLKRPLR